MNKGRVAHLFKPDKILSSKASRGAQTWWTLESILSERLYSRSTHRVCLAGQLRRAEILLLAPHDEPHYDIVMRCDLVPAAERLLDILRPSLDNPHKRRR